MSVSTRGSTPGRRLSRQLPGSWPKLTTTPDVRLQPGERVGSLEVVPAPGHTPGHSAFLDTRDRSLIGGDTFTTIGSPRSPTTTTGASRWPRWRRGTAIRTLSWRAPCAPLTRPAGRRPRRRRPRARRGDGSCDHERWGLMGRSGYTTRGSSHSGGWSATTSGSPADTRPARQAHEDAHAVAVRPRRGARRPSAADR